MALGGYPLFLQASLGLDTGAAAGGEFNDAPKMKGHIPLFDTLPPITHSANG